MHIELYKTKTMPLLEAYDRGIARVGKTLVAGTHCAVTPKGKCVGCAMGAVFLGAHPMVPCPTGPEQAIEIDNLVVAWRSAHLIKTAPYSFDESPEYLAFVAIEGANDHEYRLKTNVTLWSDEDLGPRDPESQYSERRVSVDKVRKFIIREGYAEISVRLAKPKTLPKNVLV